MSTYARMYVTTFVEQDRRIDVTVERSVTLIRGLRGKKSASGTGCSIKISNYLCPAFMRFSDVHSRVFISEEARQKGIVVRKRERKGEKRRRKKERRMGNFSYELDVNLFDRSTASNKSRLIAIPAGG